ncbi:hypothetical protein C4B63_83g93 [Trypanosoma cruzi]|uniref:DUF7623 domain-containing protein n=1 Tax=Trypanosoma cruzi TaxID=5693 RepID=A0A2V2UUF3_TRYCR|nr:hypothetical protein C4B63_83g93 [Trypanosoma cruzi]
MRSTRACRRSRLPVLPLWKWVWWRIPCFARCRTSWTVCALTRPKMRNRLRRRRGRCEHGAMELGSAKLQATEEEQRKYPFLPRRVDDVLMSDLRLAEDGVFQELVARRDALVAAGPGSNPELLTATERQLRGRASELAAANKAVDAFRTDEDEAVRARNPFLESNEVKLVPLRELGLPSDPTYAALANERLQLMQSPVRNAAAIAATEEALRGRVEELALARAAAEDVLLAKYPFFATLPGAVLLANEDIKRSPLFATLAARYEELAAQPEVDESELETVKDALLQSAARLLSEEKEAERAGCGSAQCPPRALSHVRA